jgi:hypothetical protein
VHSIAAGAIAPGEAPMSDVRCPRMTNPVQSNPIHPGNLAWESR